MSMNRHASLAILFAGSLLTGCATFTETELGQIQSSGVSSRVVAKMEHGDPVTPEEVIELTRRRVPDTYILRQIDDAGVDYVLSPADFKKLKNAGVSGAVLDALVTASNDFAERYTASRYHFYAADPYYDPYPYYGYYGPRPIYGSVGIGFSTHRHHRHHHHRHH
jgi:hypothetical protein